MKLLFKYFLLAASIAFLGKVETKRFTQLSNCKAELENGAIIDLNSLDNPQSPMYLN